MNLSSSVMQVIDFRANVQIGQRETAHELGDEAESRM
jgi:hypothetical protein